MEEGKRSSRSSSIRKLSDGERENMASSIDRLSGLPDDVICRILSFLPTKLSVATSILSRRWRFLWANVPILDLNDDSHGGGTRFSHIIQRVLLQHKGQNIDTFNLFHTEDGSDFEFETWIMNLISRNVQNLDICLCYQLTLPRCLFTCKTLVDLSVTCCGDIPMSGNVYFPVLKKLRLDGVMFESDESLPHLLSGCPVLEELIIKRDNSLKTVVCCYICSPTLKRLEHDLIIEDAKNKAYQLKLDTPTLRYLRSHDFVSRKVSAGALTSLTEADVGFDARLEMDVLYSRSALEFVGRLYNVKCLKLSTGCMKIPDSAFFALTTRFHNLTELELRADWRFISYFLENADNLEVLTFNMVDGYPKYWMEPHQVPTCLSSCLKTVTIHQFRCTEAGFELIGYILRNSEVLKLMEIYSMIYGIDLKGKFDAVKRISKFQRGSKACEVEFH